MPILHEKLASHWLVLVCALVLVAGTVTGVKAQDEDAATSKPSSEAEPLNIEKRLRRIEDNIIDMRSMIGALQSFAGKEDLSRSDEDFASPAPRSAPEDMIATPDSDISQSEPSRGPQMNQLEIQVQALSSQLSELVKRVGRLEKALRLKPEDESDVSSQTSPDVAEESSIPESESPSFGTTTVENPEQADDTAARETSPEDSPWEQTPQADQSEAQQLYAQAYDALQTENYGAARESFRSFLKNFPDNLLANEARFWLAEAAFAQGDYVEAVNAFVKVYNTAPTGEKAQDTLLRLAISLRRLDRTEAACDALSRLDGRIEEKSESFRERVARERSRSGC